MVLLAIQFDLGLCHIYEPFVVINQCAKYEPQPSKNDIGVCVMGQTDIISVSLSLTFDSKAISAIENLRLYLHTIVNQCAKHEPRLSNN